MKHLAVSAVAMPTRAIDEWSMDDSLGSLSQRCDSRQQPLSPILIF
jgi:hypothetical protein